MARNKRKRTGALRFGPAVKTVLLCLLISGSAVGYVMQKKKIHQLGREIKEREVRLERLEWANKRLGNRLADLRLPQRLDARVRELNLGLVAPQPSQIIWLVDPQLAWDAGRDGQLLMSQRDRR